MNLTNRQMIYVNAIIEHGPAHGVDINKACFSRAELRPVSMALKGKIWIPNWITHDQSRRDGRGYFRIPEVMEQLQAVHAGQGVKGDELADVRPLTDEDTKPFPLESTPAPDPTDMATTMTEPAMN